MVQAGLGKKRDPISKITRVKKAGGMAQVVEHQPSKYKARGSLPVFLHPCVGTYVFFLAMVHVCTQGAE
jgi:hypothetical protein